jgi:hypothetical protein
VDIIGGVLRERSRNVIAEELPVELRLLLLELHRLPTPARPSPEEGHRSARTQK